MSKVTEQAVIDALRMVMEPELHKDLITLNMVKDLKIEEGTVKFTVVLTTPACPLKTEIKASCDKAVGAIPGVTKVEVDFTANVQQGRSQIKDNLIPTVKNTIASAAARGASAKRRSRSIWPPVWPCKARRSDSWMPTCTAPTSR